ncbi:MAG: FGGY-family carbohydrate kinase [Alphaproteobacteria bacterium]|jgi:xylulokinase
MTEAFLGIDLGTTAVKAAVLTATGACLARFARAYPTMRPGPGLAEQDPQDWMNLIGAALTEFAGAGLRVGHGCLSSQVNTHVFIDSSGRALAPAILWQDTRAAAEAAELDAMLTQDQKIALLGAPIPIDASHPLARMLWMARHRPEIWRQTAHMLLPKDYCLLQLTGQVVTDPLANVGLVGPDLRFVGPILDLVQGAAQRMAPLAGVTEVVGRTRPEFAMSGIQMVNGTMDGWAGLVGAGATREGASVWLSGTSEVLGMCADHVAGTPGVVVFPAVGGLRLHAGPTQSGGASQLWFCDMAGVSVRDLTEALIATPRRKGTPLFLPHLAGERAPLWDASLRGAFLGLEAGMERVDLGRAVLEGVALSGRHVLEALQASCGVASGALFCGGGGFLSDPWGQIRADVVNRPLNRLAVNEPVVLGAVAMAIVSAGGTLAEAQAGLAVYDKVWLPDAMRRGLYDDLFGLYLEAVAANVGIGRKLARL